MCGGVAHARPPPVDLLNQLSRNVDGACKACHRSFGDDSLHVALEAAGVIFIDAADGLGPGVRLRR
jgi:hypothetical protein